MFNCHMQGTHSVISNQGYRVGGKISDSDLSKISDSDYLT